jgi:hypothetical protein
MLTGDQKFIDWALEKYEAILGNQFLDSFGPPQEALGFGRCRGPHRT